MKTMPIDTSPPAKPAGNAEARVIIRVEGLSHRFSDGRYGIRDIDIAFQAGSFTLIAGENGSGKTTLLMHLNGLIRAQQGHVTVDGVSVSADPLRARQLVGMVFQNADSQIVGETVADDVAFGPENLGLDAGEIRRRVAHALETMGLADQREMPPHLLSGGEKRRLAIAGILAMHPRVLVFDEPFANLDFGGTRQVLERILALHRTGHTIILTTHDLEKALAHADRLVFLKDGQVARDGRPGELMAESESFGVRQPCAAKMGLAVPSWAS